MPRIDAFLGLGREHACSDLHFTVGLPPLVRLDGQLTPLKYRALSDEEIQLLLSEILDTKSHDTLAERGSVDFAYSAGELGRFRLNIFRQRTGLAFVARIIPERLPDLLELGVPPIAAEFAGLSAGLVLVTGGPGTGKTTTLAALVHEINQTRSATIITLEDPIEYQHESANSLIVQREVGRHVRSFHEGLRSALRQDPDVILIGELRDPETITAAIEAAETGHLVLGTLHTRGAAQTIHRLVDVFPADVHSQIRHTLADNLRAVVSQELVRAADGRGRRLVAEVMVMTPAIAQLVREAKNHQISSAIATGRRVGMQLLDRALLMGVQSGDLDPDEAFLRAVEKKDFIFHVTRPELLAMVDGASNGRMGTGGGAPPPASQAREAA